MVFVRVPVECSVDVMSPEQVGVVCSDISLSLVHLLSSGFIESTSFYTNEKVNMFYLFCYLDKIP